MNQFLEDTLSRRLIFYSGKGGVGKTTVLWSTAKLLKARNRKVLVALWNPFGGEEKPPSLVPGVDTLALDAIACFREYALLTLKFEKIYSLVFDNHILRTFVTTAPGVGDGVIAGKIWNVAFSGEYDHVLVDLPSTGHTISFFKSLVGIKKIFSLGFVHRETTQILDFYQSSRTRLDLVATAEELPVTESLELKRQLETTLPLNMGFAHFNQLLPNFQLPENLPASLAPAASEYRERKAREASLLDEGKALDLPQTHLLKINSDDTSAIITEISRQLEAQ